MFKVQRFTFLIYFIALITIGSVGFYLIGGDDWSFIDSMYMTILTLSTVGFGEVHTLSEIGKLWAILLIIFGRPRRGPRPIFPRPPPPPRPLFRLF